MPSAKNVLFPKNHGLSARFKQTAQKTAKALLLQSHSKEEAPSFKEEEHNQEIMFFRPFDTKMA